MTTIKAINGRRLIVHDRSNHPERVDLTMIQAEKEGVYSPIFGNFSRDELFEALDAVPAELLAEAEQKVRDAEWLCQNITNGLDLDGEWDADDVIERVTDAEGDARNYQDRLVAAEAELDEANRKLAAVEDAINAEGARRMPVGLELPTEPGSVVIATFGCVGTIYRDKPIRRLANGAWATLDERQFFAEDDCISAWKPARLVVEEAQP